MDSEDYQYDAETTRRFLYEYGVKEWPHLPTIAQLWLSELNSIGLHEIAAGSEAPPKQADHRRPAVDPPQGEVYPIRISNHRQVLWLKLDGHRAIQVHKIMGGYKTVEVLDKPLRVHTAIISALTVLEAQPIDTERLLKALSQIPIPFEEFIEEYIDTGLYMDMGPQVRQLKSDLQIDHLRYVLSLLDYYRPAFDELPKEEQLYLIKEACKRVNKFLAALRQLVAFLEYGAPDQDLREVVEGANRDVQAAVLKDVEKLSNVQVARRLGLIVTEKHRDANDHSTAREMIKRGRKIIAEAIGEDGWRKRAEDKRAEAKRWQRLNVWEQAAEIQAELENISVEEAQERAEEITRRRGAIVLPHWLLPQYIEDAEDSLPD
jgi:hypothetical protein